MASAIGGGISSICGSAKRRGTPAASCISFCSRNRSITEMFERGPQRYIELDHARIATWSIGQGPDLVFVHGWPLWSATFRRIAPLLAKDFRLHFFDLPGTGWTVARDLKKANMKDH